jgi:hypothetical protein
MQQIVIHDKPVIFFSINIKSKTAVAPLGIIAWQLPRIALCAFWVKYALGKKLYSN